MCLKLQYLNQILTLMKLPFTLIILTGLFSVLSCTKRKNEEQEPLFTEATYAIGEGGIVDASL